jgi:hypothetical protein
MLGTCRIEAGRERNFSGVRLTVMRQAEPVTMRTEIGSSANPFIDHILRLVPPRAF